MTRNRINQDLVAAYRAARKRQLETYQVDGLHIWSDSQQRYVSARQFTGGGAAYQCHALAAYWSARRAAHFRETLAADIKQSRIRSQAARKGWEKRRAA